METLIGLAAGVILFFVIIGALGWLAIRITFGSGANGGGGGG